MQICLVTQDMSRDHPVWKEDVHVGDRFITRLIEDLPVIKVQADSDTVIVRPDDFGKWRERISALPADRCNRERFPQMLDILEREQEYWIYLLL